MNREYNTFYNGVLPYETGRIIEEQLTVYAHKNRPIIRRFINRISTFFKYMNSFEKMERNAQNKMLIRLYVEDFLKKIRVYEDRFIDHGMDVKFSYVENMIKTRHAIWINCEKL